MDDRYSYPSNYPSRNDLIQDFGSMVALDNMDSMAPYLYGPPSQYNPYHYVPSASNQPPHSSIYSHSSSTSPPSSLGVCSSSSGGVGSGGLNNGVDVGMNSFYSPNGSDDPFSNEPPLLEELGINFDQIIQKSMMAGNHYKPNNNSIKPDQHFIHEHDLGDLLIDKECSSTRSPTSPTTTTPTPTPTPTPSNTLKSLNDTNHLPDNNSTSNSNNNFNNSVDDRSFQVIYQDNTQVNHVCDNLIASTSENPQSTSNAGSISGGVSGSGTGGRGVDPGHPARSPTLNYNPINPSHHHQLLRIQPTSAATALAYPYPQRPIAIQPNLGYKFSPRFISPYMTTNVGGREIVFWSSRSPLADDSSSPSSSSTSTTPGGGVTTDKKIFINNPLLVNMLTCPQIPGLRNLAPAPDSSSHLDEKSRSGMLSVDVSGEKRKRPTRTVATTNQEPVMRPKIFDIEEFKIGTFVIKSVNEGTRRHSSTQLKVIFSKKRFIYEFAYSGSCESLDKKDQPVVYYVIAVPFESVTGLNIEDSTMFLTVDKVPFLFGGTSIRSKVLFEKAPRFDPSQGEIESNSLHCISLRPSQVVRLRTSLIEADKRFAVLLTNKIDSTQHQQLQLQQQQQHSNQTQPQPQQQEQLQQQYKLSEPFPPSKKQKLINKV